jgi:hypothetical protein
MMPLSSGSVFWRGNIQCQNIKMNIHAMDMKLPRSTGDITRRDINRNV